MGLECPRFTEFGAIDETGGTALSLARERYESCEDRHVPECKWILEAIGAGSLASSSGISRVFDQWRGRELPRDEWQRPSSHLEPMMWGPLGPMINDTDYERMMMEDMSRGRHYERSSPAETGSSANPHKGNSGTGSAKRGKPE